MNGPTYGARVDRRCSTWAGTALSAGASPGGKSTASSRIWSRITAAAPALPSSRHTSDARDGAFAEFKRSEGVDHHRKFVEFLGADACLDGAALRSVRMTAGMQRYRPLPDAGPLAGFVIAAHIEHHLVGVDVAVVVRQRNRQRW